MLYKTVSTEQIIVAAPQELINMAFTAMLRPGDHFVCMFPGYQSLYEIAQHIGCKVSFWEPDELPDGSFFFDVSSPHFNLPAHSTLFLTRSPSVCSRVTSPCTRLCSIYAARFLLGA